MSWGKVLITCKATSNYKELLPSKTTSHMFEVLQGVTFCFIYLVKLKQTLGPPLEHSYAALWRVECLSSSC